MHMIIVRYIAYSMSIVRNCGSLAVALIYERATFPGIKYPLRDDVGNDFLQEIL